MLVERDVDLFGRVCSYAIEGTAYEVVRTPVGWRARLAQHGHARRAFKSAPYESAPQVVRYLVKYAHLRGAR
ncbi:MAG: hypothetical protein CMH83_21030 [Nocardioides sp.]|nr:hypothetical protein [Nocardioides sp.]